MKRRTFLRSGLAGAAGFTVLDRTALAAASPTGNDIVYRTLGKTGLKIPVVSFGVMRSDNSGLVKAAYDGGIKMFDTAHGYQNGRNEEMLGNFFTTVPRNSFIIATKIGPAGVDRQTGKPSGETTAADFLSRFEISLSRLKMSYVDILYMHGIDSLDVLRHKEIVGAMLDLKKKGKVRFIGVSTHKNEPLIMKAMAEDGIWDVVLTAYNFKQTYLDEMNSALQAAADAGIGIVAMKTMAGGFLDKEKTKPVNTKAALKWALSNPNIHTTIPGITAFEHLTSDLEVMTDITLSSAEKEDLLAAETNKGLYCNACSNCVPGCRNGLPVPELMRAYMYAYGYGNLPMASELLSQYAVENDPCSGCDVCTAECVKGFNLKNRISDITRLKNVPYDLIS
jgi:aryl-alcohol dehydrogenase-like predicted oxidoreductase